MMRRVAVCLTTATLALGACRSSVPAFPGGTMSPAPSNVPAQLIGESAAPPSGVAAPDSVKYCRNPLFDPTDNTPLTLTGSGTVGGVQQGDYAVPDGKYGLPAGSRLRVNCATGRVLGVINR